MGLYDRDYTQANFHSQYRFSPHMRIGFPKLTPVVKWLLIANLSIYVAVILIRPLAVFIYEWFQLDITTFARAAQIWRLVSYQFLHSQRDIFHIIVNMIGLYFLGPRLEGFWGSKKFLSFYLGCGVAGALFYMFLVAIRFLPQGEMVGASGAILGLLAACAILFPQFVVILFIFPVPIRLAAVILTIAYFFFVVIRADNAGGNACHLAGMGAGAAYVLSESWRRNFKEKMTAGQRWQKKIAQQRNLQIELDRILEKVHKSGIHSLTYKEKKILKQATKAEKMRDRL
jgi:membrane associated rhomboid family serine protease